MPLSNPKYFTRKHIEANRQDAPAALAEQAVHCLELVAQLSKSKLEFTFKGGNSLLIILDKPRRFSIDVDIATGISRETVDACVESLPEAFGVFKRIEKRQHKTKPWLPMTSYELFYPSFYNETGETFIMLDVMLKKSPYDLMKRKISCGNIYDSTISVMLPKVSSIISDKLLTLGPHTLGIPFGKGKEAQRLKHVHDISLLLEKGPILSEMRKSLAGCFAQELELQERKITLEMVLEDTLKFLSLPIGYINEPAPDPSDIALREIVAGRLPFADHLFVKDYSWQRLKKDMARCAFALCAAVRENASEKEFQYCLEKDDTGTYWKQVELWLE